LDVLVAVAEQVPGDQAVDGRTRRGVRNREAIIDALIACYTEDLLAPSVQEVAERAGVSARSVHNHFVDVEALRLEVAQRQWERVVPLASFLDVEMPLADRVNEIVDQRAAIFEQVSPVRRAALLQLPESATISSRLAQADRALRNQIDLGFPEVDAEVLDAVDALLSWDTWNRVRQAQGMSVARAKRVLVRTVRTLVTDRMNEEL
jgi:TetR/AcrR family transcriptional regulator, regulator of autoinduction and epiphytic fitness